MIERALFLRPVLRKPLRFVATVLGVAAGVAAVVATLASGRAAVDSVRAGVLELSGAAALEVTRSGGVAEEELGRLAPIADDAWIAPVVDLLAMCPRLDAPLDILGVDPLVDARVRDLGAPMRERFSSAAGAPAFMGLLAGKGAFVPEPLARDLGLDAGGEIEIVVAAKPFALAVLAIVPVPEGTSAFDRLVVVDVALAQRMSGSRGTIDRIELVPRAGVDVETLRKRAQALVSKGTLVRAPRERAVERAGLLRSVEFNLAALSGISLVVGAVLVATTLATSVVQRRRTIALLVSLGASRGQIVRTILLEALALGMLGGLLGIVLGYALAHVLHESMRATAMSIVTMPPAVAFHPSLDHALAGLGLGLCAALVAAVLPVIEGARTPPIQALRGEAPAFLPAGRRRTAIALCIGFLVVAQLLALLPPLGGLPVAALLAAWAVILATFAILGPVIDAIGRVGSRAGMMRKVASVPLRLACAGLSAGRRRASWGAAAVALAVSLSISIAAFTTSFRQSLDDWTKQSLRADLSIRPVAGANGLLVGSLDPEVLRVARAAMPEAGFTPYYSARATFGEERVLIAGAPFDVTAEHGALVMLDGTDPREPLRRAFERHEALVNEPGSARFGWKPGDVIALDVRGERVERRIAGVYRDYSDSQGIVVVDEEDFLGWFPGHGPMTIGVHLDDTAGIADARERLSTALAPAFQVDVLENASVRANVMRVFDRTFAITRALQGVAAIVAVLAVLSVLYALVSERRADLALLTAVGASARQTLGVVCLQAGLLGVVGATCGILAGTLIGILIVKVVNLQSFGWSLAFEAPWGAIVSTAALVAVACALAGSLPGRAALRAPPGLALRAE